MDILVILLLLATLWGAQISFKGHPDYIGRAQTDSIKGFFAIIILFSHMLGYLSEESSGHDTLFRAVPVMFGQLMVVMFLFYSGYGIMESLKRDRDKYTANFLTHRLLKTWLMFAIAVSLYLLLSFFIDNEGALSKLLRTALMLAAPLLFSAAIVLLTMKLRFSNALLRWLGVNAFAIYILQRLAMNLSTHYELNENEIVFASIVIPATLLIAALFTAATNRMNNVLFKK